MKIKPYSGAGIACFRNNNNSYEIFLGKRSIEPDKDKWSIPGGKRENDEDFLQAALREFKEETNILLTTDKISILGTKTIHLPFIFYWKTFIVITKQSFDHAVPMEFSTLKWIPLDELPKYDLAFGVKGEVISLQKQSHKITNKIMNSMLN